MLRPAGLVDELELNSDSMLGINVQPAIAERVASLVLDGAAVRVDSEVVDMVIRRADFMTVDPTGALPRPNPVPETVAESVVGVVVAYPTSGMPETVTLEWSLFPTAMEAIPATVIDPENVTSSTLTPNQPTLTWTNVLTDDPIPRVDAVPVEPAELPLPWLSVLLVMASAYLFTGLRHDCSPVFIGTARVVLALALIVGPIARVAIVLPGSTGRKPSERQARRILAGLLPNIYRALEFRNEELIYDHLAISVTGETLAEVYLEQRRALEIEERGGAQARVETVEVLEAAEIAALDHGFGARAVWTVGGMVTHFGHRHFRQNRSEALLEIVPVDGTWKIRSIEVLETERIK